VPVYPSAYSILQSGRAAGTQLLQVAPACWNLQLETEDSLLRRLILTPSDAACARRHQAIARRSLIGYSHPSMELVAEIFIVIGAMLPGMGTVILEISLHRPLLFLLEPAFP
jgi:hypothetical protein